MRKGAEIGFLPLHTHTLSSEKTGDFTGRWAEVRKAVWHIVPMAMLPPAYN
jgi:hypothetical protein